MGAFVDFLAFLAEKDHPSEILVNAEDVVDCDGGLEGLSLFFGVPVKISSHLAQGSIVVIDGNGTAWRWTE